ncbi:uncharacterized protein LOC130722077 [Lotus japonicus]|uniref:uncharacterized protein LOC130722077 n=1 Tax=Lotus japonicus TaxID=34305 RepID=UPI00258A8F82|nr:uncharacterized protein LOC130722077 [Lotus japonicus]
MNVSQMGISRPISLEMILARFFNWSERLTILVSIPNAIHFLHTGMIPGFFKNRLKTNNIFLSDIGWQSSVTMDCPLSQRKMMQVGLGPMENQLKQSKVATQRYTTHGPTIMTRPKQCALWQVVADTLFSLASLWMQLDPILIPTKLCILAKFYWLR